MEYSSRITLARMWSSDMQLSLKILSLMLVRELALLLKIHLEPQTVSCHVFSSVKRSRHECVLFSIWGIHVYLCHQHITFKFPSSLESPLPAPPQHSRKLKIRAAGDAQADIRSFIPLQPMLPCSGRDGCAAVGSPLLAGTPAQHRAMARPPWGLKSANCRAVKVQIANNNEIMTTGVNRAHVFPGRWSGLSWLCKGKHTWKPSSQIL